MENSIERPIKAETSWTSEDLLASGDSLATSLEASIRRAKKKIDLAIYIFADDQFGQRVADLLIDASKRGVIVRVSVDGVGSRGWINTIGRKLYDQGVQVKVYHQLLWEKIFSKNQIGKSKSSLIRLAGLMNRRDHRKLCIVDDLSAWVGSMNIWQLSLASLQGEDAWCELGIQVQGDNVKILCAAYDLAWQRLWLRNRQLYFENLSLINTSRDSYVRLNTTRKLRKFFFQDLLKILRTASDRIYLTTPYFVPTNSFMKELANAVKRGVDIRILTSAKTDIIFMPWISAEYQLAVVQRGIKIFSYQPSIHHSKYLLIDNYAIIGSSNINRRSLHHDLEVDIATENPQTLQLLENEFKNSLQKSICLKEKDLRNRPLWQKVLGKIVLLFRNNL